LDPDENFTEPDPDPTKRSGSERILIRITFTEHKCQV
jgi:hypothetical protein